MEHDSIELRSEKVRNIVGKMPPVLLQIGVSVISVVLISILAALYYIPYPDIRRFPVHISIANNQYFAKGNMPVRNAGVFKEGQSAKVTFQSLQGDYSLTGTVYGVSEYRSMGDIEILFNNISDSQVIYMNTLPDGEASVCISKKPILKRIFE